MHRIIVTLVFLLVPFLSTNARAEFCYTDNGQCGQLFSKSVQTKIFQWCWCSAWPCSIHWACGDSPNPYPGTIPWPHTRTESSGWWECEPAECPPQRCDASSGDDNCCEQKVGSNSISVTTGEVSFTSRLHDVVASIGHDDLSLIREYSSSLAARHLADELKVENTYWATAIANNDLNLVGITNDNRLVYGGYGEMGVIAPNEEDLLNSIITLSYGAQLTVAEAIEAGYDFNFNIERYSLPKIGIGWTHNYSHLLAVNDLGQVEYTRPNGLLVVFEPVPGGASTSLSHPLLRLDLTDLDYPMVVLANGDQVIFQPVDLSLTQPPVAPTRIVEHLGREILFRYWKEPGQADVLHCELAEPSRGSRQLCELVSSYGARIYFASYEGPDGLLSEILSGYELEPANATQRVVYEYETVLREIEGQEELGPNFIHPVMPVEAQTEEVLLNATKMVLADSNWVVLDSENYSYANESNSALEWFESEADTTSPILRKGITSSGVISSLLKAVRDHGGGIVQGHQYQSDGLPITDETPDEILHIDWSQFRSSLDRSVEVVSEFGGQAQKYSLNSNGYLAFITDGCNCTSGTQSVEYNQDGVVMASRSKAVSDEDVGLRTTFLRDALNRTILQQIDWEGSPWEISQHDDTLISEVEYLGDSKLVTLERDRFSVLCPNAVEFGLDCEEGPIYSRESFFDYDSDYDTNYNSQDVEEKTSYRVHQRVRTGYTLTDVVTGQIEKVTKVTQEYFDNSGKIERKVDPAGVTTDYIYYGDEVNSNDFGRIHEIRLDNEVVESRGEYNYWGQPGWIEKHGVRSTTAYLISGKVHKVQPGELEVEREFEYFPDGRIWSETKRAVDTELRIKKVYLYFGLGEASSEYEGFCLETPPEFNSDFFADDTGSPAKTGKVSQVIQCVLGAGGEDDVYVDSVHEYDYDARGNLNSQIIKDPSGNVIFKRATEYDAANMPIRAFKFGNDPEVPEFVREKQYGQNGLWFKLANENFADITNSHHANLDNSNIHRYYNRLGEVEEIVRGVGSPAESIEKRSYDSDGNLIKIEDGNGDFVRYLYDDFGEMVVRLSSKNGETRYSYTDNGLLEFVQTAAGFIHAYSYDSQGRLISLTYDYAGGGSDKDLTYHYGIDSLVDLNHAVGLYDCGEREIDFQLNHVDGRLAWVEHGSGATYYSYDSQGRISMIFEDHNTNDPCEFLVQEYEYDGFGRLKGKKTPSGLSVEFLFHDDSGREYLKPKSILLSDHQNTDHVIAESMVHDALGRLVSFNSGGISYSSSWDLAGQLKQRTYKPANPNQQFDWEVLARDGLGNPLNYGEMTQNKMMEAEYDALSRIAHVRGDRMRGYQNCSYEYDNAGNRSAEVCYDVRQSYNYGLNDTSNNAMSITWQSHDLDSCNEVEPGTIEYSSYFAPTILGK